MKNLIRRIDDLINNISNAINGNERINGNLVPVSVPVEVEESEYDRKIREKEEAEAKEKYYWL